MKLFWLNRPINVNDHYLLNPDEQSYLIGVLRLRNGHPLPARDPEGNRYNTTLIKRDKGGCLLSIDTREEIEITTPEVILYQALPKQAKIDTIIRMAVEAGVSRIVPIITEWGDVPNASDNKLERYRKIATQAVMQSGNMAFRAVENPIKLADIVNNIVTTTENSVKIVAHPAAPSANGLHTLLAQPSRCYCILIGPEGGLSPDELILLTQNHWHAVSLVETIMRTETAGVFMIGAVRMIDKERELWI